MSLKQKKIKFEPKIEPQQIQSAIRDWIILNTRLSYFLKIICQKIMVQLLYHYRYSHWKVVDASCRQDIYIIFGFLLEDNKKNIFAY